MVQSFLGWEPQLLIVYVPLAIHSPVQGHTELLVYSNFFQAKLLVSDVYLCFNINLHGHLQTNTPRRQLKVPNPHFWRYLQNSPSGRNYRPERDQPLRRNLKTWTVQKQYPSVQWSS